MRVSELSSEPRAGTPRETPARRPVGGSRGEEVAPVDPEAGPGQWEVPPPPPTLECPFRPPAHVGDHVQGRGLRAMRGRNLLDGGRD